MSTEIIDLGECLKCQGQLCLSNYSVCCDRCGFVHADHPLHRQMQAETEPCTDATGNVLLDRENRPTTMRRPKDRTTPALPAVTFPLATDESDRLKALVASKAVRVSRLKEQLQALATPAETSRRRK